MVRLLLCVALCGITTLFISTSAPAQTFTDRTDLLINTPLPGSAYFGTALADFNGDGRLDFYVPRGYLYRQRPDGRFENVFGDNGIDTDGEAPHGGLWGDVNGDGLLDLITFDRSSGRDAGNFLYRQIGGERFTSGFEPLRIQLSEPGPQGGVWRDFDLDGHMDLLVTASSGLVFLYMGSDGGAFTNIAPALDFAVATPNCGLAVADYDGDLDDDIFAVGCSSQRLWENNLNTAGEFTLRLQSGISRVDLATMALWTDVNNDGRLDLYIAADAPTPTEFDPSPDPRDYLYINQGNGQFVDVAMQAGLLRPFNVTTHSVVASDFNNDGWIDLLLNQRDGVTMFLNNGDLTFTRHAIEEVDGFVLNPGMAAGDFNGDGWTDLFLPDQYGHILLYNDGGDNHWIDIQTRGGEDNFHGVGARVWVQTGSNQQLREITAGSGDLGQSQDMRAHFGLGSATSVDLVRVEWPDGSVQEFADVASNQRITIVKDVGINEPPAAFSAISPAPASFISTSTPSITFDWEDAVDAEDNVVYTLDLYGEDDSLQFTNISGSSLTVDTGPLKDNSIYSWTVVARDPHSLRALPAPLRFSFGTPDVALNPSFAPAPGNLPIDDIMFGSIRLADFNADGILDLFAAGERGDGTLYANVLTGQRDTLEFNPDEPGPRSAFQTYRLRQQHFGILTIRSASFAFSDRDGDGVLDVLLSGIVGGGSTDAEPELRNYTFTGIQFLLENEAINGVLPVWGGDAEWVDVNGDQEPDLVISGSPTAQPPFEPITTVYLASGADGPLVAADAGLPGMMFGDFDFADFDRDGDQDVVMTGEMGGGRTSTAVYDNNGNGVFEALPVDFPALSQGSVDWGDFDGDGFPDLLLSGGALSPEIHRGVARIYRNNGMGGFAEIQAPLQNLVLSEAQWVDYDLDGDLDIFMVGADGVDAIPRGQLLLNQAGHFLPEADVAGALFSSMTIGDYDGDSDPDIVFIGMDELGQPVLHVLGNPTKPSLIPVNR